MAIACTYSIDFYSHAICSVYPYFCKFLLTRLMRGVTPSCRLLPPFDDFYSHASCEAWQMAGDLQFTLWNISTHTPHARRDHLLVCFVHLLNPFLLTRLMRGVTSSRHSYSYIISFLLTRLMRGVTPVTALSAPKAEDFYSHASCEAWLAWLVTVRDELLFLLTRLMRGVTGMCNLYWQLFYNFYSHASCEAWLMQIW